jgi:hypothetical protein
MAASERLIITCNGRSIKNNTAIPLVTPLAELVDFCGRNGVKTHIVRDGEECSQIEIVHPRHAASEKNFETGTVIANSVWSPDESQLNIAEAIRGHRFDEDTAGQSGSFNVERQHIVELADLERAFVNPLDLFLRNTLGVYTYREDLTPDDATLPLASKNFKEVAQSFLDGLLADGMGFDVNKWRQTIRLTGLLPVGAFGESELLMAEALARSFVEKADEKKFHLVGLETVDIELRLADQTLVRGSLPGVDLRADEPALVFTSFKHDFDSPYWSDRRALAVRLVALIASGSVVDRVWAIHQKDKKKNADVGMARKMPFLVKDSSVDPLERLEVLKEMYYIALSTPVGRFDGAVHKLSFDRDAARKSFDDFVRSERYSNSGEFVCFGPDPDFDVVCAPGGTLEHYWTLAETVLQIAPGTNQGVYVIS